jgi:arsenate reductase-like glutaredoxin family protein
MLFVCYLKCSTCAKARKWLLEHNISSEDYVVEDFTEYFDVR